MTMQTSVDHVVRREAVGGDPDIGLDSFVPVFIIVP
jgi:hypothetical protein